jgi:hypothetical protein
VSWQEVTSSEEPSNFHDPFRKKLINEKHRTIPCSSDVPVLVLAYSFSFYSSATYKRKAREANGLQCRRKRRYVCISRLEMLQTSPKRVELPKECESDKPTGILSANHSIHAAPPRRISPCFPLILAFFPTLLTTAGFGNSRLPVTTPSNPQI